MPSLRHSSNGSVVRCFASKGTNLLRSSSALVMLPSLLSSMYARDTAGAQRFSYCRYSSVLRKREALLRCRPIDRKWRRRKSCAADYYCSCQNYLAHVRLSLERDPRTLSSERKMNPQWTFGHAGILSWGCRDSSASPAWEATAASPMKTWCFSTGPRTYAEIFGHPAPRRSATDRILHPRIDPCVSLVVGIAAQARP